jgi:superfamily II DNA or RNA helicase
MAALEDLKPEATVRGILPDAPVTVISVKWFGNTALELTYRDAEGRTDQQMLYRDREHLLEVVEQGRSWSFEADGAKLRLASEARRIQLAYLFDPLLAVNTSLIDPLPHQITAVYEEMLPRQPLRFLLADDPGSGKTIMAGLLIKELLVRGDLRRCLVCCPGNLVEQWQDELHNRFHLDFAIISRQTIEDSATVNPYLEKNLVISRLDYMSRNEDIQAKLKQTDWDLIICDEAHKMSARYFGGQVKYTKRYRLGQLLGTLTRHLLLMTATPHNGKEADFQLFLALLDGDRFEGEFRDGVHTVDASDLMRRLAKEQLLKFDGKPLFPERRAYSPGFKLSDAEARLYEEVTEYVREEFNRADALESGRRGTVGFALTVLQRRLASSPEAIFQSLHRRRERLQKRLSEEMLLSRGEDAAIAVPKDVPELDPDDLDDLDDAPGGELEEIEEKVVDQATAAQTIRELCAEIATLERLEGLAANVRASGADRKWEEFSALFSDNAEMFDAAGHRRKLVVFTEHRDTLNYLADRLRTHLGRPEAVVTIHGGMGREDRRKAEESFKQDRHVEVLVATDAAGEGINLQRAHLMVNYDLPWNPNRLEQRFGRIHRIGQTEVCHLWNLVASETREGEVFQTLFKKLEEERAALGGQVFDVLGEVTYKDKPLRDLLLEAIRYGDTPEVRERLNRIVEGSLDRAHLQRLIEDRAITRDMMDATRVETVREKMERAEARRLQPHFIASFFLEAFRLLGGCVHEREPGRYEVTHVPSDVRERDRAIGSGPPLLRAYERITFHKDLIAVPGKPLASFVCPGHPLLDATVDIILERYRHLLKQGAVLVDEADAGATPRVLAYLEHSVQDARTDAGGNRRVISQQMQFVEIDADGAARIAGPAPYLDYRPATADELAILRAHPETISSALNIEERARAFAIEHLVPQHLGEVRARRERDVDRTVAAVTDRLTKEINDWDLHAAELEEKEKAGKKPRMNSARARQRADELQERLKRRLDELEKERAVSALPPWVSGGALIVPVGFLRHLRGQTAPEPDRPAVETAAVEAAAMAAVMAAERALGNQPRDVSADRCGYDIESREPSGRLRFIEVKGRAAGATTVCVTRNEILTALNKPDNYLLAIVEVDGDRATPCYVHRPFRSEPDFGVTSVNYDLAELASRSGYTDATQT